MYYEYQKYNQFSLSELLQHDGLQHEEPQIKEVQIQGVQVEGLQSVITKLHQLDKPPAELFFCTQLSKLELIQVLSLPQIAVVGTRRVTSYGRYATQKIISELSDVLETPVCVVSGFMYGVDQTAHRAALQAKLPTICVLGHGFGYISQKDLHLFTSVMQAGGVCVSEYAAEHRAQNWTFIHRNRLIAAFSDVLIVPEAAIKSGSMHTVQFALKMGKSIGAIPGMITNPYAEGTKYLVNQGAALIGSGEDVLSLFPEFMNLVRESRNALATVNQDFKNSDHAMILNQLTVQSQSVSQLAKNTKMPLTQLLQELTTLELSGKVNRENGYWVLQYSDRK